MAILFAILTAFFAVCSLVCVAFAIFDFASDYVKDSEKEPTNHCHS